MNDDEQQSFCRPHLCSSFALSRLTRHEKKAYAHSTNGASYRMTGTDHCHVECMYEWERILNSGHALVRTSGVVERQAMMTRCLSNALCETIRINTTIIPCVRAVVTNAHSPCNADRMFLSAWCVLKTHTFSHPLIQNMEGNCMTVTLSCLTPQT
jgi:hypothetical protein